jgi:hypothetical protein
MAYNDDIIKKQKQLLNKGGKQLAEYKNMCSTVGENHSGHRRALSCHPDFLVCGSGSV